MKTIIIILILSKVLIGQAMNPDGYIGGITFQGLYFFNNGTGKYVYNDLEVGKTDLNKSQDFLVKAKIPVSSDLTVIVQYRRSFDENRFTPSLKGKSIGFHDERNDFTSNSLAIGLNLYIKKIF